MKIQTNFVPDGIMQYPYRVEVGNEAFEFSDRLDDIEYFTWHERFQSWMRTFLSDEKRDHTLAYQNLIKDLELALENYKAEQDSFTNVQDPSEAYKKWRDQALGENK